MTNIQIVRRKGGFILVEWISNTGLKRAWVTPQMVNESGQTPTVSKPERGIPYGVDFSALVTLSANSKNLDEELKRRGIWTVADLRANPLEVMGALQATYGIDLAALLQAAKQYEAENG